MAGARRYRGRVGILGGTFNPVHRGHLAAATAARQAFQLDTVLFIPAALPPHKTGQGIVSFAERAAMLELALAAEPSFRIATLEAERPYPSYTIDTLAELHRQAEPGCRFFFIIGSDAFAEIGTWRAHHLLLEKTDFVVIARSADAFAKLASVVGRAYPAYRPAADGSGWLGPMGQGRIRFLTMEPVAVSSTMVRERLARGETIDELVGPAVAGYIREKGLYRKSSG